MKSLARHEREKLVEYMGWEAKYEYNIKPIKPTKVDKEFADIIGRICIDREGELMDECLEIVLANFRRRIR